jgi:hypothetical protein
MTEERHKNVNHNNQGPALTFSMFPTEVWHITDTPTCLEIGKQSLIIDKEQIIQINMCKLSISLKKMIFKGFLNVPIL